MAKHEPYSRREVRRLRRAWLSRNRRLVVCSCLVVLVTSVGLTAWWVLMGLGGAFWWYVLGVLHTFLIGGLVHAMHTGFLLHDPDGLRQLRGACGEENTRTELQSAKRRRLIWGWVDSINLDRGDLDHLVVTRRGGVLVIDSKWRNTTNVSDTRAMAAAARKVQLRADAVARSILGKERTARHRASVGPVTVRPVVVLWGAEQHRLPGGVAQVDGIDFVAGRHFRRWLRELSGEPVNKDAAAELRTLLEAFRSTAGQRQGVKA